MVRNHAKIGFAPPFRRATIAESGSRDSAKPLSGGAVATVRPVSGIVGMPFDETMHPMIRKPPISSRRLWRALTCRESGGLLVALLLVAFPTLAPATTWIKPQRALSSDEWLVCDLSGADAVGIGQVLGVTDTIADFNSKDGTGIGVRFLTLRVAKWIKGDLKRSTLLVGTSPLDMDAVHGSSETLYGLVGSGRSVLLMLRSRPDGWVFCDGPDPDGSGLRLIPAEQAMAFERKVRGIVASQSPDSLLMRADLVFLGRGSTLRPCRSGVLCTTVKIDTLVAGKADADSVLVFAPLLGEVGTDEALYLLREDADKTYDLLGYRAGVQTLRGGRLNQWRMSTAAVRERLRHLAKAPAR